LASAALRLDRFVFSYIEFYNYTGIQELIAAFGLRHQSVESTVQSFAVGHLRRRRIQGRPDTDRKVGSYGYKLFPDGFFYTQLGLVHLPLLTQTRPWATA